MKKSEGIAKRATDSNFLVTDASENDGFRTLLDEIRCLTITNHIIYNHEYRTIIENHLHFLMGMNPSCINYVSDETEWTYMDDGEKAGLMNDPLSDAMLILLISAVKQ
jgi:endoglucanase